ncbi:MAG: beta-lactamase family protein [Acidimicrobiaceae bacterium]|nr:beta-lactamase family protein [Acidimicrobiaceae bacterium]
MAPAGPARGAADPLAQVESWPVTSAVAVIDPRGYPRMIGPAGEPFAWASLTKLLSALAVLVAVEEGTVSLDDPAGPEGSTIRHLLAHASGLAPDDDTVLAPPATRRIYSNRGIEVALDRVAAAASMPWEEYLSAGVLEPLGLAGTQVVGSPAYGATGPLTDLARLASEWQRPVLISPATWAVATTAAWSGLPGVLPGFGHQESNDWGLGVEIRDHKTPHWTGSRNSPATFGHFGRSGSFLWVDPAIGWACCGLADTAFGAWAARAWPALSDAVVAQAALPAPDQHG